MRCVQSLGGCEKKDRYILASLTSGLSKVSDSKDVPGNKSEIIQKKKRRKKMQTHIIVKLLRKNRPGNTCFFSIRVLPCGYWVKHNMITITLT